MTWDDRKGRQKSLSVYQKPYTAMRAGCCSFPQALAVRLALRFEVGSVLVELCQDVQHTATGKAQPQNLLPGPERCAFLAVGLAVCI